MCALRVAHDGRPYHGFQRQPDVSTIEDAIFDVCHTLGVCGDDGEPVDYAVAGQTDAGVSALVQTAVFECPDWCVPWASNLELSGTTRAQVDAGAPGDFHAQHQPARREYVYDLHVPMEGFGDNRAKAAFGTYRGDHDFCSLASDDHGTVRAIDDGPTRGGDSLLVHVKTSGFARELVRRLVSLIHAAGSGAAPLSKVGNTLGPDHLDGPEGIAPAPPTPLLLTVVDYLEVEFGVDAMAAEGAAAVLEGRALTDRIGWHVSSHIRKGVERASDARRIGDGENRD